ncbi:SpoIID/LytB domain-containing protein [Paenibacillaceae bacterium]|nr:SpoIID/LytB domain-containing protein [Paenibacillaceae bacterium]
MDQSRIERSPGRRVFRRIALLLAVMMCCSLGAGASVYGETPRLDNVRVAMFLNLPGKFTTTTPTATLSGEGGLKIGARGSAWLTTSGEQQARFALNSYNVAIVETGDFAAAVSVLKKVRESSSAAWLTSFYKQGKTVYRVSEGQYSTADEAGAAQTRWAGNAAVAGLAGQSKPAVAGPFFLETQPYKSLADANKTVQALGAAGIEAYPAVKQGAGGGQYVVHVGAAANASALSALQSSASKVEGVGTLSTGSPSAAYVQIRQDYARSQDSAAPDGLYLVGNGGLKLWVEDAGGKTVKLAERDNRAYRGAFEISGFNNRLAIINEVPFEQYLYSVVGAEMPTSWPIEALKAQAVTARSFALFQGTKFEIAHMVDTNLSQVYNGIATETASTIQAVDATKGEVMLYNGKVIEALFSSNAGGATSDGTEVWGNKVPYLTSVQSPDEAAEEGLYQWYRVVLKDGKNGYIREDLLTATNEKTAAGSTIMTVNEKDTAVRPLPFIQTNVEPLTRLSKGTRVIALEKTMQSNTMSWIRGPFTSAQLVKSMDGKLTKAISGPIQTLEVSERGPSNRALTMAVNGSKLEIRYPDMLRTALGGLPSTRFTVEETGRINILGADQRVVDRTDDKTQLHIVGADVEKKPLTDANLYVLDSSGTIRTATKEPMFRFTGTGYGHGIGMSQWGAKGLADQGYDYQKILEYYYKNATLAKG